MFNVDQRGVVSSLASIDREDYDSFRFPVVAVDAGTPSRTGSALVVIDVDDVNDERPRFTQKVYVFRVWENELPGTKVIRLNSLLLSFSLFSILYSSFSTDIAGFIMRL